MCNPAAILVPARGGGHPAQAGRSKARAPTLGGAELLSSSRQCLRAWGTWAAAAQEREALRLGV